MEGYGVVRQEFSAVAGCIRFPGKSPMQRKVENSGIALLRDVKILVIL